MDAIDSSQSTFLANTNTTGNLEMGFRLSGGLNVVNGTGSDIALFFLLDQSSNTVTFTTNGVTHGLSFQNVYNSNGLQVLANGVRWDGITYSNVLLMVAKVDLSSYGLVSGQEMAGPVRINMTATGSTAVPLALVGAIHTYQASSNGQLNGILVAYSLELSSNVGLLTGSVL